MDGQPGAKDSIAYLSLTPCELEVLSQLAAGRSNREVGEALHKQVSTVRHQVSSILRKLGVHSRLEAALIARDVVADGPFREPAPGFVVSIPARSVDAAEEQRGSRAAAALVAYLRLLGDCLHDEAHMIEENPARGDRALRRFRGELLEMSLKDAPVDALLERIAGPEAG